MSAPVGTVAVIPARGGSKGIPGKNMRLVGGRSLVARAVLACRAAARVDEVVVSTDDALIATEARRAGATVLDRPAELASDEASSESVVRHAIDVLEAAGSPPETVVLVQCTSPFIRPADLDGAVGLVRDGAADCAFAAVETFGFLWELDEGSAVGVNHDHRVRLRRQERTPNFLETGAFYVFGTAGFRASGHRFFGRVLPQVVDPATAIEIDEPRDLDIAEVLSRLVGDVREDWPARVDVLITDFDGVHTDDRVVVGQDGSESVAANRRDGHGVKLLREAGIPVLILSTERNEVVARRAEKLGIECVHGLDDKAAALLAWLDRHGVAAARVAYLGNDVNDLGCMRAVGFPLAVADAHPDVLEVAVYVTSRRGGDGAVREVAELLVRSRERAADRTGEQ